MSYFESHQDREQQIIETIEAEVAHLEAQVQAAQAFVAMSSSPGFSLLVERMKTLREHELRLAMKENSLEALQRAAVFEKILQLRSEGQEELRALQRRLELARETAKSVIVVTKTGEKVVDPSAGFWREHGSEQHGHGRGDPAQR